MAKFVGTGGGDVLTGTFEADEIYGRGGADFIDAGKGADFVLGGGGNDIIDGNKGSDTIYGGSGDDTIFGGAGDDFLSGDVGADTLTGDGGDDTFFFSVGAPLGTGVDAVTDFSFVDDVIVVGDGSGGTLTYDVFTYDAVDANDEGSHAPGLAIYYNGEAVAVLEGVAEMPTFADYEALFV